MKKIIKKILKEEFEYSDTQSDKHNICDIMTVNSIEEIVELVRGMEGIKDNKKEVVSLLKDIQKDKKRLSNNSDILNTYLRKIQNILCK
jgi:hypothetical protein